MFVLIYAPHGIIGEDGSSARLFASKDEAWQAMHDEAFAWADGDEDVEEHIFVDEMHATLCDCDPDSAEWHIYEVKE